MKLQLAYGQGFLPLELPDGVTTVIEPTHIPGVADEREAVRTALENPIAAHPLREWIQPGARVCIVFTDLTRATPNERLIPWLLEYLHEVPSKNITLLNGVGTHRPNTAAELEQMLTPEVARKYRVLNHNCENADELIPLGTTRQPALGRNAGHRLAHGSEFSAECGLE